jgi:guanosine-3',5'-bis(diphosphate) 3'-pyrophosphohydrolase
MALEMARLLDAISFSAEKHRNQRRKDHEESPYINHPIALATLLANEGGVDDVQVLQAAVLHDTIEDTDTTYEELVARFGKRVADIVTELTDDKNLPKDVRKQVQIDHAPHKTPEATLVKLADKTCNLRDIATAPPADWSLERRREYFEWAKRVVHGLPKVNEKLLRAFNAALRDAPGKGPAVEVTPKVEWISSLERHVPREIWHKPIDRIEAPELLDAVVKVTSQYPETGRRVRQRLELVFADAEFRKLCNGNPGRAIREKVREECGGRKTESYRTLHYRDVPLL